MPRDDGFAVDNDDLNRAISYTQCLKRAVENQLIDKAAGFGRGDSMLLEDIVGRMASAIRSEPERTREAQRRGHAEFVAACPHPYRSPVEAPPERWFAHGPAKLRDDSFWLIVMLVVLLALWYMSHGFCAEIYRGLGVLGVAIAAWCGVFVRRGRVVPVDAIVLS